MVFRIDNRRQPTSIMAISLTDFQGHPCWKNLELAIDNLNLPIIPSTMLRDTNKITIAWNPGPSMKYDLVLGCGSG